MELLRHVLGATDLVACDVEGGKLTLASRLDLDQHFRLVLMVERQNVEPQAISDLDGGPLHFSRKIVSASNKERLPFQADDDELFTTQLAVRGISLSEIGLPAFA